MKKYFLAIQQEGWIGNKKICAIQVIAIDRQHARWKACVINGSRLWTDPLYTSCEEI
jgi:hypothetical protein